MARGSITWREDRGAWQVQASGMSPAGKRVRPTRLVRGSRRDADKALTAILAELDAKTIPSENPTVGQVLEAWWTHHSPSLALTTAERYRGIMDDWLLPRWGKHLVSDLRVVDADLWLRSLAQEHDLAASTLRQTLTVLRSAMKQAVRWEMIPHNPVAGVTVPRAKKKVPTPPTAKQVVAALALIAEGDKEREIVGDPEFAGLARVAAACGLRRSEVAGLRWGAVDIDSGEPQMTVREAVVEAGGELHTKETKTERQRVISLDAGTVAVLAAHRARLGREPAPEEFVWSLSPDGMQPMVPTTIGHRWVRWRSLAGLPSCRLHDLRHFMATEMIAAGEDIVTVSNRLGHAKVSTTLDIYAHAMRARDATAAARIGSILDATASDE